MDEVGESGEVKGGDGGSEVMAEDIEMIVPFWCHCTSNSLDSLDCDDGSYLI